MFAFISFLSLKLFSIISLLTRSKPSNIKIFKFLFSLFELTSEFSLDELTSKFSWDKLTRHYRLQLEKAKKNKQWIVAVES